MAKKKAYFFLATHKLRGYYFGDRKGPPQSKVITEKELAKYSHGGLNKGTSFKAMSATKAATSTDDLTIPSDCQKKRNFRSGCICIACFLRGGFY